MSRKQKWAVAIAGLLAAAALLHGGIALYYAHQEAKWAAKRLECWMVLGEQRGTGICDEEPWR